MNVELLAPGGSYESVIAAINAGADAVYTGGALFGAREYADNLSEEELMKAIRYAHIHGRKLYLTVNTLLKDREIENQLYDYIKPLYENGLDAVIVQDLGVLQFIREHFEDLHIHASTQMTIMGFETAEYLKSLGAMRIVTPRELSLKEIKDIKNKTDIEIESFVHGALCYCYSGQCFLSSYIGGRSGNRGKCAQPCRLNYDIYKNNKLINQGNNKYVLSPKDMCTLEILPEIIKSGVYSLKIEGRMKKKEYTAGIVSLYRKYIDLYLKEGKENYKVSEQDLQRAADLFNRNGFSQSYYKMHNGKSMISLIKPEFRQENAQFTNEIREKYIQTSPKENINIYLKILKDENATVIVEKDDLYIEVKGDKPSAALKAPLTKETLVKQISKLGQTEFIPTSVEIELEDGLFMTMGQINELRREAIDTLEEAILNKSRRKVIKKSKDEQKKINIVSIKKLIERQNSNEKQNKDSKDRQEIAVLVTRKEQMEAVIKLQKTHSKSLSHKSEFVSRIYVSAPDFNANEIESYIEKCHNSDIKLYIAMPYVFRMDDKKKFEKVYQSLFDKIDGFLVRNIEEYFYLKELDICADFILDYNIYSNNKWAKEALGEMNKDFTTTVPVELNDRELAIRECDGEEMVVYGYMPVMTSANCLMNTCEQCNQANETVAIKDRMNQQMNVKCVCEYCYNIIYNCSPLSLIKYKNEIKRLKVGSVRAEFTFEDEKRVYGILTSLKKAFQEDIDAIDSIENSTRGHFKRGVK